MQELEKLFQKNKKSYKSNIINAFVILLSIYIILAPIEYNIFTKKILPILGKVLIHPLFYVSIVYVYIVYNFSYIERIKSYIYILPILLILFSSTIYVSLIQFYGFTSEIINIDSFFYFMQSMFTYILNEFISIWKENFVLNGVKKTNITNYQAFYILLFFLITFYFLIENELNVKKLIQIISFMFFKPLEFMYLISEFIIIYFISSSFINDFSIFNKIVVTGKYDFNSTIDLSSKKLTDFFIQLSHFPKLSLINQKDKTLVIGYDNHFLYYYNFDYVKNEINSTKVKERVCNNINILKDFKDKNITSSNLLTNYLFGVIDNQNLEIRPIREVKIENDKNEIMLNDLNSIIKDINCTND